MKKTLDFSKESSYNSNMKSVKERIAKLVEMNEEEEKPQTPSDQKMNFPTDIFPDNRPLSLKEAWNFVDNAKQLIEGSSGELAEVDGVLYFTPLGKKKQILGKASLSLQAAIRSAEAKEPGSSEPPLMPEQKEAEEKKERKKKI